MGLRKLSPGGHEYLTNTVACGDHDRRLEPGELLSDYYLPRGYPAGQWFGAGADRLGLSGAVTPAQMQALFGEGRHPHADAIEAEMIADGATADAALKATRLGRRFPQYSALDHLRSKVSQAYKDYNTEHDRPVGAPIPAAIRAELRHKVQRAAFREAHDGSEPANEQQLQQWLAEQNKKSKNAVSGYELVFAPDKSVSLAWAMAEAPERELIAGMVRQAAHDALSYVERHGAFTRRGVMGEAQVDIDGITAALFEHWDSRSGDPHLHIHALVSAKVPRSDDGDWTALDGRTIHAATVTASEFFDSRLRDLFREQGATWTQRGAEGVDLKRPVWQLAGVPVELVEAFSKRHRQFEAARARRIVAFRQRHGHEPKPKDLFEINRQAQYDNRPAKAPPRTLDEHRERWHADAVTVVDPVTLDVLGRRVFLTGNRSGSSATHWQAGGRAVGAAGWRRSHPPLEGPAVESGRQVESADIVALAQKTRAVVADTYAHFSWWNLAAEAHRQSAHLTVPPDKREQLVDDIVDTTLAEPDTLALTGPTVVEEPPTLRRRDGESVFVEHRSTRYTTTATLAAEADLVTWARQTGGPVLRPRVVDKALAGHRLNAGQQAMVRGFALSDRRLQLALAPAGAGKTSAMKVLAAAWRRGGRQVYAFGPSARAAQELGAAIGATPHTLHQLTTTQRLGFADRAFPFTRGDLVIIDEAAMAGTHTLHAVVAYALERGAAVRLIGDDAQLAAVEAGGAIRLLAHEVGAVRFHAVVRFQGPDRHDQAAASLQIRDGNPQGLKYYFDAGRVADGSLETMRDAAHEAWLADLDNGVPSLLIVPTNEDTRVLNAEARAVRLRRGDLPHARAHEVALHDTTTAGVGDWVVTRHNQRLLALFGGGDFVKNGDTWTITAVHRDGRITVKHRAHRGTITLPAAYVGAHVELAYAATVNRVQGMTSAGHAHLLVPPTMTREQLYPGITRATVANFLYVVTHHHVVDQHQETPEVREPYDVLVGVLKHSEAEVSATETLREKHAEAISLATLVLRHNYTATYRDDDRYRAILTARAPSTVDQAGEAALIQTLRNAHDLGFSPDTLVATTLHHRPLHDTKDPAAVLQSRIAKHVQHHAPPPATAPAAPADLTRWRTTITTHAPHLDTTTSSWEPVWRRTTGALADDIDVNGALTALAHTLATLPHGLDPASLGRHADGVLAADLAHRHDSGDSHRPAVPWLARPDFAAMRHYPGHAHYVRDINTAIAARVNTLRAATIANPPTWTQHLGTRPDNTGDAARWDRLVGLIAAYRETFRIPDTEPQLLGPEPDSHGIKARAWHELTAHTNAYPHPPDAPPRRTTAPTHATVDVDGDDSATRFDDTYGHATPEPLDVLLDRYERRAHAGDNDRYLTLLDRHAPGARTAPAHPALLRALARAQDAGWQAHRLIHTLTAHTDYTWANDPAAALTTQIRHYTHTRRPPARTATPTGTDIDHWRALVHHHLPHTDPTTESWNVVWRHAAGGTTTGLDATTALTHALTNLDTRHDHTTTPDHHRVAEALVTQLHHRNTTGEGLQPVLPWQAQPDLTHTGHHRDTLDQLDALNTAIAARTTQLREHVTHHQPRWAAALGPRPTNPDRAERWDHVVTLAAAYRETHHITTTNPDTPLGTKPTGNSTKSQAWQHVNTRWRTLMTQPDREDAHTDAMLTAESHRDTSDALNHEFHTQAAARAQQLHDDETRHTTYRDETVDQLDDRYDHHDDLGGGLSY